VRSTSSGTSRQTNASDSFAAQHAGQQAGLAEDLEAVADPEHEPPPAANSTTASIAGRSGRSRRSGGSRRTKSRREDDRVEVRQLRLGVPDEDRLGVEGAQRPERVAVVAGPGNEDADPRLRARHARLRELDLVALDQRVRQQLLAHLLELRPRLSGSAASTSRSTSRPTAPRR
jgi:hypothetical protein